MALIASGLETECRGRCVELKSPVGDLAVSQLLSAQTFPTCTSTGRSIQHSASATTTFVRELAGSVPTRGLQTSPLERQMQQDGPLSNHQSLSDIANPRRDFRRVTWSTIRTGSAQARMRIHRLRHGDRAEGENAPVLQRPNIHRATTPSDAGCQKRKTSNLKNILQSRALQETS